MVYRKDFYIDPLTGVYSRGFLESNIAKILQTAREEGRNLQVVLIDIDYFKRINDFYGHLVGDQVLREFADFLKNSLRANDILIRYGGDEFIAILKDVSYSDAYKITERILYDCRLREFGKLKLTFSAGIGSFPQHGENWESLFEYVDRCLYIAKRQGRNKIGVAEGAQQLTIPTYDIVNRVDEITTILDFFSNNDGIKILHVTGPVGVGKTRVIKEALAYPQFESYEKVSVSLSPAVSNIVLYPFRTLLSDLISNRREVLQAISPSSASELLKFVPKAEEENGETLYLDKFKLFNAINEFLKFCFVDKQALVFFENAHWLDSFSLELMSFIIKSTGISKLSFVLESRIEELNKDEFDSLFRGVLTNYNYRELVVKLLRKADITELAGRVFGQTVPDYVVDFLYKKGGGSPFITYEIIKSLVSSGQAFWGGSYWEFKRSLSIEVPFSVDNILRMELSRLDDYTLAILEIIAVYNETFSAEFLQEVSGFPYEKINSAIDKLSGFNLIEYDGFGLYRITKEILMDALYNSLKPERMEFLHNRIADVLEMLNPDKVESIANHYFKGGNYEKALDYLIKSAKRAVKLYAYDKAVTYLSWALSAFDKVPKLSDDLRMKAELLLDRSRYYLFLNESKSSMIDAEKALSLALTLGDEALQARANLFLGRAYKSMENKAEAKLRLQNAYNVFQKIHDLEMVAECNLSLGELLQEEGNYKVAKSYYLAALDIAQAINHLQLKAHALFELADLEVDLGNYNNAEIYFLNSLEIARNIEDRQIELFLLNGLGILHSLKRNFEEAIKYYSEALKLSKELGNLRLIAAINFNIGTCYFLNLGELSKAISYFEESSGVFRLIDEYIGECSSLNSLGIINKYQGNFNRAREYFESSLKLAKKIKNKALELSATINLGGLYIELGLPGKALSRIESALQLSRKLDSKERECNSLSYLGQYHYVIGDFQESERYFKGVLNTAEKIGDDVKICDSYLNLAMLYTHWEKLDDAEVYLRKAQKLLKSVRSKIVNYHYEIYSMEFCLMKGKPITLKKATSFIEILIDENLVPLVADAQIIAARIAHRLEMIEKAREFFEESILNYAKMGAQFRLGRAYAYYGHFLNDIGEKAEAIKYFEKAKRILNTIGANPWLQILNIPSR